MPMPSNAVLRAHAGLAAGALLLSVSACAEAGDAAADITPTEFTPVVTQIAEGLEWPWGIAALPNGDMLVTEREGRVRLIRDGTLVETPVSGAPTDAYIDRQGGYLDLELHPGFAENRLVYMSYSQGDSDSNRTAVLRATLSDDGMALERAEVIFTSDVPEKRGGAHFGSRIGFLSDGSMLVTLGDGYGWMDEAQNTANHYGKVVRLTEDGAPAAGNPFAGDGAGEEAGAGDGDPAVFTYGHRNVQGLAYDADRDIIYAHEHGPKGGDELNLLTAGTNYGWPEISYGVDYDGTIITPDTAKPGMAQPAIKWVPSIAPSGMALYTGEIYPGWQGDLFIGAMNGPDGQKLVRVDLDGAGQPVGTEDIVLGETLGFRDVVQGVDGHLYLASNDLEGGIYRLDIADATDTASAGEATQ
ncbi:MAG: PQQ-dependent sugar dehydrogenase [Pseudomonadota bacterium]